jgi:2-oxo-4-hydroxy-4-carboxy-5-ureidoimidazoline decarboxylase
VSGVLARWNALSSQEAAREILACCGSEAWAARLASRRPFADEASLRAAGDEIWRRLEEADWLEAFRNHPRIGESRAEKSGAAQSAAWSAQEQEKAAEGGDAVKSGLQAGNREYERKFGRLFIVCAAGKSASEILEILRRRLDNDEAAEIRQAAEEQRQIMHIRLAKWLAA